MKCIICYSDMTFYFRKTFNVFNLKDVEYWKCKNCGFCASKTHFDMTSKEWAELNYAFHSGTHYTEDNPYNRNQRYFNQALMLSLMFKQSLIKGDRWLDWGCGIGSVALLLKDYFNIELLTYDRYFTPQINSISEKMLVKRGFHLVVNTAVF